MNMEQLTSQAHIE